MTKVVSPAVVIGLNTDDTRNFFLDTDAAGALRIRRKSDGSGALVLSIDASGIPRDKDGFDLRPLGVGQTWQNMTGSRTLGSLQTNNTGRTIVIRVTASNTSTASSGQLTPVIAGSSLTTQGFTESNGSSWNALSIPLQIEVPPGNTYQVNGTNATLLSWWELRT